MLRDRYPAYPMPQYSAWALSPLRRRMAGGGGQRQRFRHRHRAWAPWASCRPGAPRSPAHRHHGSLDPMPSFAQTDPPAQTTLRRAVGSPLRPPALGRLEEQIRALARQRLDELGPEQVESRPLQRVRRCWSLRLVMASVTGLPIELGGRASSSWSTRPSGASRRGKADDAGGPAAVELHTPCSSTPSPAAEPAGRLGPDTIGDRRSAGYRDRWTETDRRGNRRATVHRPQRRDRDGPQSRGALPCSELFKLRPEQLAAGPGRSRNPLSRLSFEETLRYGAPLQYVGRTATRDVEIAGARILAGHRILLLIPSANRDPREFDRPDDFVWNRAMKRHSRARARAPLLHRGARGPARGPGALGGVAPPGAPLRDRRGARSSIPPSDSQIGYVLTCRSSCVGAARAVRPTRASPERSSSRRRVRSRHSAWRWYA